MKLGTCIFLLVMILISFGYVISNDQETHRRLNEVSKQNESLKSQMAQANQQLNVCQETIQKDQETISQQAAEIGSLKTERSQQASRIANLEKELQKLNSEKSKLQAFQAASAWLQMDPLVLAALLIVQVTLFIVQKRQKKGYVRLSEEERALIINMRRMKKM